jgi:hypothetical protein
MDIPDKITIAVLNKICFKMRAVSMAQAQKIKFFGSAGKKPSALMCVIVNITRGKENPSFY